MSRKKLYLLGLPVAFAAVIALSACSPMSSATTPEETTAPPAAEETMAPEEEMDPAANLVGAGCAAYAEAVPDGAGSVAGMAQDPVATAASNNPILTTLVAAVSGQLNPDVNLVDTLNGDEFTVFAPVDDAFAKIDPATIEVLKTDSDAADVDPHVPRRARPDHARRDRRNAHDGQRRRPRGHRQR